MSSRILPQFELLVPQSIEEATSLLAQRGDKTAVMAGGTDLLVYLKSYGERTAFLAGHTERAAPEQTADYPEYVLSLSEIPGLDHIDFSAAEGLRIGAMASLAAVVETPVINQHYPALWQSAAVNGTAQTRNAGTVVGNLLNGSPAGDCCCAALACGGTVVLQGPEGKREVGIDAFWTGYRQTARRPDEIAVEVHLPAPRFDTVSAFQRLTRVTEDIAKINAAVQLSMEGQRCLEARLAMGCVAPTPIRLEQSEALLKNRDIGEGIYEALLESVRSEINPIDDVRSSADYRREVAGVLLKRTIQTACGGR